MFPLAHDEKLLGLSHVHGVPGFEGVGKDQFKPNRVGLFQGRFGSVDHLEMGHGRAAMANIRNAADSTSAFFIK